MAAAAAPEIAQLEASSSSSLQWAQLPQELLELISGKLPSISDHLRFRSVCRSWRSAAKSSHFQPQIPLLILPHDSTTTLLSFLNPSNGRIVAVDIPELHGHAVCGTSVGWLVRINRDLQVSLLNPLTGSTIPLPPPSSTFIRTLNLEQLFMNLDNNCSFRDILGEFNCYAFTANYPDDCIVVFTALGSKEVVYCRLGDITWTKVGSDLINIASLAYHKRKLYAMDRSGDFAVCDVENDPMRKFTTVPSLKRLGDGHMGAWDEDLLIVDRRFRRSRHFGGPRSRYEIYKLFTSGDWRWERLNGIGDLKLFFHIGGRILFATDAYGLRGNSIYYLFWGLQENIVRYDIGSGIIDPFPGHYDLESENFSEISRWMFANFL